MALEIGDEFRASVDAHWRALQEMPPVRLVLDSGAEHSTVAVRCASGLECEQGIEDRRQTQRVIAWCLTAAGGLVFFAWALIR